MRCIRCTEFGAGLGQGFELNFGACFGLILGVRNAKMPKLGTKWGVFGVFSPHFVSLFAKQY